MMNFKHTLLLFALLITACSELKNSKYKDTSYLEMPPEMEIIATPDGVVTAYNDTKDTGLGTNITLAGSAEKPVLEIKKLFPRAWNIVEQALKLNEIEITDKNRDQGIFYVLFDLNKKTPANKGLLTFFSSKDEYKPSAHQLTVVWRENTTEVSIKLLKSADNDLLEDDEDRDNFDNISDAGKTLLKTLYKTIQDDLPIN